MFYEDAKEASRLLDLVLTSRGHEKSGKAPMCGIPYHAAEGYISRLVKAGKKVAICEQVEDPALAKGIVKRDVIRVISAGTYIDEENAEARYLICLYPAKGGLGLSLIDATQGTLFTNEYSNIQPIIEKLAKLPIYECIFPEKQEKEIYALFHHPFLQKKNIVLSPLEDWYFNPEMSQKTLCEHFHVHSLKGFGLDNRQRAISAAGALLEYLKQMNKKPLAHVDKMALLSDEHTCYISPAACHGLELETLRKTLDKTTTALGRRKFREWLYHPLKDVQSIVHRQEAIAILKEDATLLEKIQHYLRQIPDIEKNLSRLSCGYTSPKDILALRNTLEIIPSLSEILKPLITQNSLFSLPDIPHLRELLSKAINPEMPLSHPEGKIIRNGYSTELDELRNLQENGRQWLADLQTREVKRTGIPSLKIGFNKVFGYYIEVTKTHLKSVPTDYIRKQTLVNAERFITPELKEFEEKILLAEEKILAIENAILKDLQQKILAHSREWHLLSENIAVIDSIVSLALLARQEMFCRPHITEEAIIDIKDGRHPVVETTSTDPFVPNDTFLNCDDHHLAIITGPNMSGKSTYIRQVAILVIMAQMGSFIPAGKASIGIVDKIFTRIGAQDDITKGQSTFMVEMSETADILNNLSEKSLVILDEIGRGTSTFDGLSLAWALAEYLQAKKVRTLFATHFHELTGLAEQHKGVVNYNVAVKEWGEEIVFLHKIVPGGTDDSYGIYVAKIAGIPKEVIQRAEKILSRLEMQSNLKEKIQNKAGEEQLSLFSQAPDPIMKDIKKELETMKIDSLTPLEALNRLEALKKKLENKD